MFGLGPRMFGLGPRMFGLGPRMFGLGPRRSLKFKFNFKRCASSRLGPAVCWEEDMMPGLRLLLSQDVGVQCLRGEK